jgi:hypothetical protein
MSTNAESAEGVVSTDVLAFSEKEMRRYFATVPKTAIILAALAVAIFLSGLTAVIVTASAEYVTDRNWLSALVLFGISVILAGTAVLIVLLELGGKKPTDQEYDAWVGQQEAALELRAAHMLDIETPQGQPNRISLRGMVLPSTSDASNYRLGEVRVKKGKDGKYRCSVNSLACFWLADRQLVVYKGVVSALIQSPHGESTGEFYYSDIVGMTTSDDLGRLAFDKLVYLVMIRKFSVIAASGDSIVSPAWYASIKDRAVPAALFNAAAPDFDGALSALRSALRTKK